MARTAKFTVTLSAAQTSDVAINYETVDGTAKKADGDYTHTTGVLTIPAGQITGSVSVPIRANDEGKDAGYFNLKLTSATSGTISRSTGQALLPGEERQPSVYAARFHEIYDLLKDRDTGYFGPPSGPKAYQVPYHSLEEIIVEAPDWGHESVSETASFYVKLEAWRTIVDGDTAGYAAAWKCIEDHFIPGPAAQPWGDYAPHSPAQFQPDGFTLEETPTPSDPDVSVGQDPLFYELQETYQTKALYLMHWLYDVDGIYGFKDETGDTKVVAVNNFQRGPVEDGWATITHPCWDDYKNGGHPTYGWQPIYQRCPPLYADAPATASFSPQWNYSVAPDAESRAVASAFLASLKSGKNLSVYDAKAKKMADYLRYSMYDKYFRPINGGYSHAGCHYLLSWGCGFGGGMPNIDGATHPSYWGFRIGNSEIHFGYNGVDMAYACSDRSGKGWVPAGATAGETYRVSLDRQLELIRWLQSPEGPIAGGVTSNYRGNYGTPTDGRENATFYGLYYTYSPSWHSPPSNNWAGFQCWGLERVANLYELVAAGATPYDVDIRTKCGVILDRFMNWLYDSIEVGETEVSMVTGFRWTEGEAMPGTASAPNAQGTYEYLPTLSWDSTGDYAAFWNASSVPNPDLHCAVAARGLDFGIASGYAQMIVEYCAAKKKIHGNLTGVIPGGTATFQQLLDRAINMLDVLWNHYRSAKGFGAPEVMEAFTRMSDVLWVPPEFGTGTMPNGDVVKNGETTFLSMRSFYQNTAMWPSIQEYLDGGDPPTQTYHRFWANVDMACAYAMLEHYFPDTASA